MTSRVERILTKLAHSEIPYVLQQVPQDYDTRMRFLADELSLNGVMVLAGTIKSDNVRDAVNKWATAYVDLYKLLTSVIFPDYMTYRVVYADKQHPPLLVFHGDLSAMTAVMAGYVTPYIAAKQRQGLVSEAELLGLMTYILEALAADDLSRDETEYLHINGQRMIMNLLTLPVQHFSLTNFTRPLFTSMPKHDNPSPAPAELPEPPFTERPTDTQELFTRAIHEELKNHPPPPLEMPRDIDQNGHDGTNGHSESKPSENSKGFSRHSRRRRHSSVPLRRLPDEES